MRIPANLRLVFLTEAIKQGLKVLTYDIETSHSLVRTFYIGSKVFIGHKQVKTPGKVISIQYKWMHEKKAKYLLWKKVSNKYDDTRNFDDSNMLEEFASNILPKADIIITQNGDRFDFITLNERIKILHLSLLESKPSIDILKLSRKSFRALSHKLDYRSAQQGLGGKISMEDSDWVDIEERGLSPLKKMVPYGLKDTEDTELLFIEECPYYKDLPVPVEKEILKYLQKSPCVFKRYFPEKIKTVKEKPHKIFCLECNKKRRKATDITVLTKTKAKCNRCRLIFEIKVRS